MIILIYEYFAGILSPFIPEFGIVKPEVIMFSEALSKTRSGRIMRHALKAIATQSDIGNVMTLANPEVVEGLIEDRKKLGEIKF